MAGEERSFDLWSWLDQLVASSEGDLYFLLRLVVAAVLAGAIGWDRERRARDAGLRTHMLVGIAAALIVTLGGPLLERYRHAFGDEVLRFDPARLIEAMITGVSFLGAGTIFVSGKEERVQGLTTAASLLATATVGIAVGIGRYVLAVGTTTIILIVLGLLRRLPVEKKRADQDRR